MHVRRDCMVHMEVTANHSVGGAICMTFEMADGQFGFPRVYEVGPFDTALDLAVWLRNQMVDQDVLSLR